MNNQIFFKSGVLALAFGLGLCGCSKSDEPTPQPKPVHSSQSDYVWSTDGGLKACNRVLFQNNQLGNGDKEFVFTGQEVLPKGVYHLKGWVYIAKGAQLTIQPGTIITGDKVSKAAIIVEKGGKLVAQGTADQPIVFTSDQPKGQRKPGDWGGIILCGEAPNNQGDMQIEGGPRSHHGGKNLEDNSGVLSYVRIEFAGYPFEKDKEINGLTFGSVGRGTKIDHIQVSYSNDDSYEWFGGNVNANHLIAYKGWDDDFDTDNGFAGHVQFGLSVRDPHIADASLSNGFESDNCADGAKVTPNIAPVFSNFTFIGPKVSDKAFKNESSYINGGMFFPNNGSSLGRFQAAMQIRRNSKLNCFNSVLLGFPVGLILENDKGDSQGAATKGEIHLEHLFMAHVDVIGSDKNKSFTEGKGFAKDFFLKQSGNKVLTEQESELSVGKASHLKCLLLDNAIQKGADFSNSLLSGFEKVSYVGAFGNDDNWLEGWTNFDPNNTDY